MMVDSDGPEYVMAAKFFYPAHHTVSPLYLLIGHGFLQIPFGADYWKMSLMSWAFTIGSMIFLYLIIQHLLADNKRKRLFGCLAVLIFSGAALVIAQAIIVETYAVVTMFSIAAYYFVIKKKWAWASAMLGMGLVTHHLILLTWLVLFVAHKELKNWKRWGLTFSFLIFYIYMPLSIMFTDQPDMWGNTGFADFFTNNIGVFMMLVGQKSIYDLPMSILDTIGILGISLGLALIPVTWYFVKQKKLLHCELFWLFMLPIIYFGTDLAVQIAKYMEASIAWGAIIAVLVLSKWNMKWTYATMVVAIGLLSFNSQYFAIGRNLDPNLAAQQFYDNEIPKMKDGDIFVTMAAWEWIEIFLYNKEEGRNIIPVCVGILASERYQDKLREKGVKVDSLMTEVQPMTGESNANSLNQKQVAVAMSILENNDNVWVSRVTDPRVYGAEIVPAKGNEELISQWVGEANVVPKWQWQPMNPWDFVSGAQEQTRWKFILQSTYSCLFFAEWATFGVFFYWCILRMLKSRKKKVLLAEQS
jgi:hypothetical protein